MEQSLAVGEHGSTRGAWFVPNRNPEAMSVLQLHQSVHSCIQRSRICVQNKRQWRKILAGCVQHADGCSKEAACRDRLGWLKAAFPSSPARSKGQVWEREKQLSRSGCNAQWEFSESQACPGENVCFEGNMLWKDMSSYSMYPFSAYFKICSWLLLTVDFRKPRIQLWTSKTLSTLLYW